MSDNLQELLRIHVNERIDPTIVSSVLDSSPFIQADGLFNLRDISDGTQSGVKRNYCFRSGAFENITDHGKNELKQLGIKTIFDLRSARETNEFPDPNIDGIEVIAAQTETDPLRATNYSSLVEMYIDLLETHKAVWTTVLTYVRDFPDRPFLVHCTGGKDRTGLAVCLIHSVAGISESYITHEYALTRIGIEPARDFLMQKLGAKPPDLQLEPKLMMFMRIDPEVMDDFLKEFQAKFGGVEKYVTQVLGFKEEDLEIMRRNLRV